MRKARIYQEAGIPEYWLADLDARSLLVLALVDGVYRSVPEVRPGVARSALLPGFVVDTAALFARLVPGRA